MRFFGGLSVEETAEALTVSPETVMRDWRLAKAWLLRELAAARPDAWMQGSARHGHDRLNAGSRSSRSTTPAMARARSTSARTLLAELCSGDEALRREVESLLAHERGRAARFWRRLRPADGGR